MLTLSSATELTPESPAPGLYRDVSWAEYESCVGIRASIITELATKSPRAARHLMDTPRRDTDALRLGRAQHCALFEADRFKSHYAVFDGDRRTKQGKADYAAIVRSGKEPLKTIERDACQSVVRAVRSMPRAIRLLTRGYAEVTMLWDAGGFLGQGRIDWLPDLNRIVDLKTTTSTDERDFGRQFFNLGYDLKLAWYQIGLEALTGQRPEVWIIAVESAPPHDGDAIQVPDDVLDAARSRLADASRRVKKCRETGVWPGRYATRPMELDVPAWAHVEEEMELTIGGERVVV